MNIEMDKNRRWGIIGTVLFHVVLLFVLFMLSMEPPFPLRPVIGLEVNLGNSDNGMGDVQPPEPTESASSTSNSKTVSSEDKVVTQETEESINLKNSKSKKQTKPTPEEVVEPKVDDKFLFTKKNNNSGGNEGITGKPGDQGNPNGVPNSDNYVGVGGDGDVAWNLSGRKNRSLPKPQYNSDEQGSVVVKIWVNRSGKVVNARIQVTGTTTSNSKLQDLALQAALKATFNSNPDAPDVQTGTITYQFVL